MGILSICAVERGKHCVCSSLRYNDAPPCLPTLANKNVVFNPISFGRSLYVLPAFQLEQGRRTNQGYPGEVVGYIGRVLNTNEEPGCWTMGPYIMQSVLILIAPALFAASIYMILGRIILLTEGEHHSLIRRKWLTKIFVFGDVASFMLQSSGMRLSSLCE